MTVRSKGESHLGDRGQSEVLGMVLLLGFTILAATSLFVAGMSALEGHQGATEIGAAENEMALFGSKVSEVALGDSSVQTVSTDNNEGSYEVKEDTGSIEIKHIDRDPEGSSETIDEFPLGEVTYTNGDTRVAYQGGGVWKHENDHTTMVSPPEFHYRHGTLTLPVINVVGDDRATGQPQIVAQRSSETNRIYPNPEEAYKDGTAYTNPVEEGRIKVVVQSEYHLGWKAYFEDRTDGDVTHDPEEKTVSVELTTFGDQGLVDLNNGESIDIRAANDEEPMQDFNLTLVGDGSSGLNNLDWSFEVDGEQVLHLHAQGNDDVTVTIDDPDSDEVWTAEEIFEVEEGDPDVLEVDLMSDEEATHPDKDPKTVGEVFNDLISAHGGEVDLTVEDSNGAQRVDHSQSTADIEYEGDGSFITYLQITENDVEVKFS